MQESGARDEDTGNGKGSVDAYVSQNCDENTSKSSCWSSSVLCHHPSNADKDQGYAWVVLACASLSAFLARGLTMGSYGTVNLAEQHKFKISVAQASFIGTLLPAIKCFAGLLVSVLVKKLSCRTVQMVGGSLAVIGFGCCAFATQPWQLYILYDGLVGFGVSSCFVAYPAALVHHFNRYKSLAYALCAFGNLSGIIVSPSVSQALFSAFGYSTTMGILGLCMSPLIVAGLFFTESRPISEPEQEGESSQAAADAGSRIPKNYGAINSMAKSDERTGAQHISVEATLAGGSRDETEKLLGNDLSRLAVVKTVNASKNTLVALKILITNWKVWCLILNCGLWNIALIGYLQFINDYVVKYCGLTEKEGALGVTISGFGCLAGNFLLIGMGRMDFDRLPLYALAPALYGACTIGMAFSLNQVMFYALAAVWGVGRGIMASTFMLISVEYVGGDLFPILFGLNLCAQGFTGIAIGPICSYLQIHVHQVAGLCFIGASGIAATLVLMPVVAFRAEC